MKTDTPMMIWWHLKNLRDCPTLEIIASSIAPFSSFSPLKSSEECSSKSTTATPKTCPKTKTAVLRVSYWAPFSSTSKRKVTLSMRKRFSSKTFWFAFLSWTSNTRCIARRTPLRPSTICSATSTTLRRKGKRSEGSLRWWRRCSVNACLSRWGLRVCTLRQTRKNVRLVVNSSKQKQWHFPFTYWSLKTGIALNNCTARAYRTNSDAIWYTTEMVNQATISSTFTKKRRKPLSVIST